MDSNFLQEHHISYDPEVTIRLCVSCHGKEHGHGVGLGVGEWFCLNTEVKGQFIELWESGQTYQGIMDVLHDEIGSKPYN